MTQLTILDFALRGAKSRLDTVTHLYEMYKDEEDAYWMGVYQNDIENANKDIAELKEIYQQAHVEASGVRATDEWLKNIYGI